MQKCHIPKLSIGICSVATFILPEDKTQKKEENRTGVSFQIQFDCFTAHPVNIKIQYESALSNAKASYLSLALSTSTEASFYQEAVPDMTQHCQN